MASPSEVFEPDGAGPHPGVVVIHESYGLNDDIRRIARRFASNGYVAVAPDVLTGGPKLVCIVRAMRDIRRGHGPAVDALEGVIADLRARDDVTDVGVAGFCMGGGFALILATRGQIPVAGAFYGDTPAPEKLRNACPIVGGYGAKDRLLGREGPKLDRTLDELGIEHDLKTYDDAGHSYMSEGAPFDTLGKLSRPLMHVAYNERAAEDSWARMLAFFGRFLGDDAAAS
jgi:carboxymethylenebutenolidase